MKVIAVATVKGGVGKTVLSAHLAAALARLGRRTLLLDLDPQGHATSLLGFDLTQDAPCAGDALLRESRISLSDVLIREIRENLDLAPASLTMGSQERQLHTWALRLKTVRRALTTLREAPDAVVIDCPPHVGGFTEAALHAADLTLAPIPALAGSLKGLADLKSTWEEMRDGRPGLVAGVINLWDVRTTVTNSTVLDSLQQTGTRLLQTRVPKSEIVNQAALNRALVFDRAPHHPVAEVFERLAQEAWELAAGVSEPEPQEDLNAAQEWVVAHASSYGESWGIGVEAYLADGSYSIVDE